jgi:hypothetical protein
MEADRRVVENALAIEGRLEKGRRSNVATLLRPAFDALWQACGQEKSPNYDDEGNRRLDVGRER